MEAEQAHSGCPASRAQTGALMARRSAAGTSWPLSWTFLSCSASPRATTWCPWPACWTRACQDLPAVQRRAASHRAWTLDPWAASMPPKTPPTAPTARRHHGLPECGCSGPRRFFSSGVLEKTSPRSRPTAGACPTRTAHSPMHPHRRFASRRHLSTPAPSLQQEKSAGKPGRRLRSMVSTRPVAELRDFLEVSLLCVSPRLRRSR